VHPLLSHVRGDDDPWHILYYPHGFI
jgi:hypothetical protein